ncbi:TetR/AcrR family transcriptional regulator [Streptomyces europaeiscabiei]|uniref:TetR/AcrR family transcriptional regulator n=1 Tax=Streptomyces europaeiscabiei TaxID=146819 RepID=UPI000E67F720
MLGDPSPRKTRRVQPEERAAGLLAAATELFRTRGCAGTAMADISAAAGVTQGSLNRHYSQKDDMCAAVMGRTPSHPTKANASPGASPGRSTR